MSKKTYNYKEKMNKNQKKKEKSSKLLYTTMVAYGVATVAGASTNVSAEELEQANAVDETKTEQSKEVVNEKSAKVAPQSTPTEASKEVPKETPKEVEQEPKASEEGNLEIIGAKDYLRQVAGDMSLKYQNMPAGSSLQAVLGETYQLLESSTLTVDQSNQQVGKLMAAEGEYLASLAANKEEVGTKDSAATDSNGTTSNETNNSEQTNNSTMNTSGKENKNEAKTEDKTSKEETSVQTGNENLDKKIAELKGKKLEENYSKESAEKVSAIINDIEVKVAEGSMTTEEAEKALKSLEAAEKGLQVDTTNLTSLMKQIELDLLKLGSINQEKAKFIQEIINEAKALEKKKDATQTEINKLVERMNKHASDLNVSSEDLLSYVDEVSGEYKQTDYTALSYKQLNDALSYALLVSKNSNATQSEIYFAYNQIQAAVNQLVAIKTASELQEKIDEIQGLDSKEYTSESYKEFSDVLKKAQKVMNAEKVSTDTYSNMYHQLMKSIDDLVSKDDISKDLEATINEANQLIKDNKQKQVYTNDTLSLVLKQLKVAETVDYKTVSADRLVEINTQLKQAISGLVEIENLKGLETLINEGNKLIGLGKGNFTSSSWETLNKQLSYAEAVMGNSKSTVDEISKAYQKLDQAIDAMVNKASLLKELDSLLFKAEGYEKDESKYTTESWASFENALIKAKAINRETINPDTLNSLVNELAMTMNHLFLTSNEAINNLQKELEKLVTLDKESAYTSESWRNLQQVVKTAYDLVDSIDDIKTSDVLSITEQLSKAIDGLTYSATDRQNAKNKLKEEISIFDKMTEDERKKILHGYEEYEQAINSTRDLLDNLNVATQDMSNAFNKITTAKNNLTIDEGSKTILVNTDSSIGKNTGMKDGKFNVEVKVKNPSLQFFTYKPSFETTVKIPHNLIPFFENGDWRQYVQIAYNNSAGSVGIGSVYVQSGDKTSGGIAGIGAKWDPTLNLLSLDDAKVLNDLKITYKIVNGQPVLYITTNKMTPGTGLMPVNEFELNYYLRFNFEQYLKDGHVLPIQEKNDDTEVGVVSKVLQEGILIDAFNMSDKKNVANLSDLNKLDVQDKVVLGDVHTQVVDGTNTIVGNAKQTGNKGLDGDQYQAVFELNGKEIGRTTVDKDGNFIFNYTVVDSKTGNIIAQNFKDGDNVKVTIVRMNEKYDVSTSSDSRTINVVKGKSPKVDLNSIKQNGKTISGKISTLTTQDGKSMAIDPSDKNVYTVRLVYYAPGQATGIELAEVRTDKYGNFSYVTSMALQYGGRIEAIGYVYQGAVNSNGDLTSTGIQLTNSDTTPVSKKVEWNIAKPSVNQIKEGDTIISGQAPVNEVKFNEANYKVQITIGDKVYLGDIDDNGMFSVNVRKVERGEIVKVDIVGFVPGKTAHVTGSEVVESVVVASSEANDKWTVNKPTINTPKAGESTLTGIVLLDDSPTRKYYLTVTVNGVEINVDEGALNRETGRIQIDLGQKIKASDVITVTLHGLEKGYDGEKSATTDVEIGMPESFENWEISHPVVKDPQIGDKVINGYVKVDSSYDRTYYVQVKINNGKIITGEVDQYGNFSVTLPKALEGYDDVSVVIVGQQGDAGKKQSQENLKRVPAKNTEVNKNGLEAAIDVAEFYSNENNIYTNESFDKLSKALESAKSVFENSAATQLQVNTARDALNNAINNLVTISSVKPSQVSLDALQSLLKEAEGMSPSKYSGTTYKVLVEAMDQSKQALLDEKATQDTIEDMITLLYSAMEQLKAPSITDPSAVDQNRLEELIAAAKQYKGSDYTEYSFAVLQEAIRKGDEALGNPNAATLNSAFNELKRAMEHLVPVVAVGEAGREQLLEEINQAKLQKETDYTTESYNKLQVAISYAEKIYGDKNSSVESLSEARNQLLQARKGLVSKDDLRKQLSITYVEAKDAIEKQKISYFTNKSYSVMNEAYKKALELDKNRKATANELNQALLDLQKAISDLVPSTNIETLQKLIDEASEIISKPNEKWKYTTKTWNELNIQLHNAKDILSASESAMEDISIASNHLSKALNNLISKEDLLSQLDVSLEAGKTVDEIDYSYYNGKETALNQSYQEFKKVFEKASKIDRSKIEADELSKLIDSLNQSIASLVTTKEEATQSLIGTLEKAKTSGISSDTSRPNDLYKNGFMIKNSIKNAENILKDPKATADDINNANVMLQEALDNAEYQEAKANDVRKKIDQHIKDFSKLNPKDYVIGYDDYEKVIKDSQAELNRNYGLTLDELTDMLTNIENTKKNLIKAREINFVTMGNTKSEFENVVIKDGKLTFKTKSKQSGVGLAVYSPSFETRIELPKSMKVIFESPDWRDYVSISADAGVGVLISTSDTFKVDKIKLSQLQSDDITVEYFLSADGIPTLRIVTRRMANKWSESVAPQTWFKADYDFDFDLAAWSRDHNTYLPLNTEGDNTMRVITELNKKPIVFVGEETEGTTTALNNDYSNGKSNGSTSGLGGDKGTAQVPVSSAELGNVLVSGGTVIHGRVQQNHNTDLKDDAYKVRIEVKHADGSVELLGFTDLNDDNTFMFVYGEADKYGNITAKGFNAGDVILATVIRENKARGFVSESTTQEWSVGKAKAPEVTLDPIKNGSKVISGNISGMMDQKGNYVEFNPNDLNVYKVKLTYYSPDGKAIQLSEVSVDRQTGEFEYYVGTPLEFGGYVEAQVFVYAGKLNSSGTLVGVGKQLQDVMPQITQADVEWGVPDPLLNQAAEGDTSISGLVPNIDNGDYRIRITINGQQAGEVEVTKDGLFKLDGLETPLQVGDTITAQLIAYRNGESVKDKNGNELASNITTIKVKNADDLYKDWTVKQPSIDDLFEGKEYVTGTAPNDNSLGRTYDVIVTVNGTKTYRGKLDSNGHFMVKVDKLNADDKVEVQIVGHQPNKKDKFSDISEAIVQLSQSWEDWKLQPIEVKQPSANDNVIIGKSINNDFSNGRTYTAEVQINGGAVYTGTLNPDGTFSINVPTLSYKDEISIRLVGHQAGYNDKLGNETIVTVDKENQVDKSKLQNLYSNVKNTSNTDHKYTTASYREFEIARENAKAILENPDVTQEQVDEAYRVLKQAFENLVANDTTEVDKTELEKVYEETNPENPENDNRYSNDDSKYPDDIYNEFEDAREKAKEILDDPEATQSEIDEATKELNKSKENLDNYFDNNVDPGSDGSDSDNSDSDGSDSDNSDSDSSDSDDSDSDNSDSDNSDSDGSDSDNSDSDDSDSDNSDSDNSDSDNSESDNSDSDDSDSDASDSDNSDSDNSDSDDSDSDNSDSDNSDSDNSDSDNSDSDASDSDNSDSDSSDSDNSDSDSDNSDSDDSDSDDSDSDDSDSDNSDSDNSDSDDSDSDNSDSDNSDSDNSDSDDSDSDNSDSDSSDSDDSDSDNSDSDSSDSDNSDSDNSDSDCSDSDNSDSDDSDSDDSDSDNSDSDNSDSDDSDSDNSDSDDSDSDNSDSDSSDSDDSDSDNSDSDNSDSDNSDSDDSDSDNSDSDSSDSDDSDSDNSDSDNSDSDSSDSDDSDSDNSDSDDSDSDNSDSDNSDSDDSDSDDSDSDDSDSDNSDSDNSDSDNSDSDDSDSDNSDSDNSDSDNSDSDDSDSDNSDSDNSDSDDSDSDNSDSDNSDSDDSDSDNSDSDSSDSDNSDSDNSDSDDSDSDNSDSDDSDSDNSDSDNSDSDDSDSDNSDSDNSDSDNSDSDNSDSDDSDSDSSDSDSSDSDSDDSDSDNSDSDNSDSDDSDSDNSDSDNSDSDDSDSDNSDSENSDSDDSDSDNSDSDNSDSDNSDSDSSDSDASDSDNSDNSDSDESDSDNSDSDDSDSDNSDSDNSDSDDSDSDNSDSDSSDSDDSDSDNSDSDNSDSDNSDSDDSDSDDSDSDNSDSDDSDSDNSDSDNSDSDNSDSDNSDSDNSDSDNSDSDNSDSDNSDSDNSDSDNSDSDDSDSDNSDSDASDSDASDSDNSDSDDSDSDDSDSDNSDSDDSDSDNSDSDSSDSDNSDSDDSDSDDSDSDNSDSDNSDSDNSDSDNSDSDNSDSDNSDSDDSDSDNSDSDSSDSDDSDSDNSDSDNSDSDDSDSDDSDSDNSDSDDSDSDNSDSDDSDSDSSDSDDSDSDNSDSDNSDSDNSDSDNSDSDASDSDNSD
ncbi:hypothetical protein, partial [Vagococcus hydrophili]